MGLVAETIRSAGRGISTIAAPKALLSRDQVVQWYKAMADSKARRTTAPSPDPILPPSSERGGYVSSEHSQGELMPEQLDAIARKEWQERRRRKLLWESLEAIERMRLKSIERR